MYLPRMTPSGSEALGVPNGPPGRDSERGQRQVLAHVMSGTAGRARSMVGAPPRVGVRGQGRSGGRSGASQSAVTSSSATHLVFHIGVQDACRASGRWWGVLVRRWSDQWRAAHAARLAPSRFRVLLPGRRRPDYVRGPYASDSWGMSRRLSLLAEAQKAAAALSR